MTQYHVTVDEAVLHKLVSGNDRGLAELLQQVLNQILEAQRDESGRSSAGATATAISRGSW